MKKVADATPTPKPRRQRSRATGDELAKRAALRNARVEYAADLMRTLRYKSGATTKALAREWHLPLKEAGKIAVDASRRVREECGEHDTTHTLAALDRIIDEALIAHDFKTAVDACHLLCTITGAGAPTKIQARALTGLSAGELRARKAEIVARLTSGASEGRP